MLLNVYLKKSNKHPMVIVLVMNGHFILYRFVVIYIYIYKWHSIIILSVINVGFISYRFVVMTISSFINNYLHVNYFKIPAFSVYGKHYFKMINEKYDIVYVFTRIFVKVFYHVHSRYVEVLRYRHLIHLQRIHRLLVIKH